jgi:hypothetical protein
MVGRYRFPHAWSKLNLSGVWRRQVYNKFLRFRRPSPITGRLWRQWSAKRTHPWFTVSSWYITHFPKLISLVEMGFSLWNKTLQADNETRTILKTTGITKSKNRQNVIRFWTFFMTCQLFAETKKPRFLQTGYLHLHYQQHIGPNVVVEWLTLLLRIR